MKNIRNFGLLLFGFTFNAFAQSAFTSSDHLYFNTWTQAKELIKHKQYDSALVLIDQLKTFMNCSTRMVSDLCLEIEEKANTALRRSDLPNPSAIQNSFLALEKRLDLLDPTDFQNQLSSVKMYRDYGIFLDQRRDYINGEKYFTKGLNIVSKLKSSSQVSDPKTAKLLDLFSHDLKEALVVNFNYQNKLTQAMQTLESISKTIEPHEVLHHTLYIQLQASQLENGKITAAKYLKEIGNIVDPEKNKDALIGYYSDMAEFEWKNKDYKKALEHVQNFFKLSPDHSFFIEHLLQGAIQLDLNNKEGCKSVQSGLERIEKTVYRLDPLFLPYIKTCKLSPKKDVL